MSDRTSTTTRERLERVREARGYTDLRSFWRKLTEPFRADEGFTVSYDAARTYHLDGREPPAAYLARVAQVFGISLEWLVTGGGKMDPALTVEEATARLEESLTADLFAGVAEGFGEGADRLLRGVQRAAVVHTWRRFRFGEEGSLSLELSDAEMGRAIGEALRAPFTSFGLDPARLPDNALTDYTLIACAALNHLTEVTDVEREVEDGQT